MLAIEALSYWEKSQVFENVDLLVIGSGYVGLSCAIQYKKKNPKGKVLILERGYLPSGASTKNAGFACVGSPSELLDDINSFGEGLAIQILKKRVNGLLFLQNLVGDTIDYQEPGSYEIFKSSDDFEKIQSNLPYLNNLVKDALGLNNIYSLSKKKSIQNFGFKHFNYAVSLNNEGVLNPYLLTESLIELAHKIGIRIINGMEVLKVLDQEVQVNQGTIPFKKIAICNNGLAKELIPNIETNPARAQVIVTSPLDNLTFQGSFHFDQGYYYFRNVGKRVLFGGGRNTQLKTEFTASLDSNVELVNHLKHILEESILPNQSFSIDYQWAGTMGLGPDKSPIIKSFGKNKFCAVNLGGMGVAIGTQAGKELAELILEYS